MMSKIIYDSTSMKIMSSFEMITKSRLKDLVVGDEVLLFIVNPGEIGRAVGAKGVNVKKLERIFKKKIKIVEFASELVSFIKNLAYPLKVADIIEEDGIFTIIPVDSKTRSILIGKNACNLRFNESVIKRYFPIKELRVGKKNG
ncbi:NusA-like transcription termination signal-binding factor [Candidatus Woesearchaeota archaeon]|nr:NusA-like transcription termination signal-binding factor [Candidatus Woesearchaeota archaeon]